MPVYVIDTLKPKNGLDFPVVEAIDVAVEGYSSLEDAVTHFATDTAIAAINAALETKANTADVATSVQNLQGQIDQIVISASAESVVAPEVAQARVDADGVEHETLKERIDKDSVDISAIALDANSIERGTWTSGEKVNSGIRLRTKNAIKVKKGDCITFETSSLYYIAHIYAATPSETAQSSIEESGWINTNYVIKNDGFLVLMYANASTYESSTTIVVADYDARTVIIKDVFDTDTSRKELSYIVPQISKNLIGKNTIELFPCFIPAGTKITMSTADGQALDADLLLNYYGVNKNYINQFRFPTADSSRTVTIPSDTYYLAWTAAVDRDIQVEIGEEATTYEAYFKNTTGSVYDLCANVDTLKESVTKKMSDFTCELGTLDNGVNSASVKRIRTAGYIEASKNFTVSTKDGSSNITVSLYDKDKTFISVTTWVNVASINNDNVRFIRIVARKAANNPDISSEEITGIADNVIIERHISENAFSDTANETISRTMNDFNVEMGTIYNGKDDSSAKRIRTIGYINAYKNIIVSTKDGSKTAAISLYDKNKTFISVIDWTNDAEVDNSNVYYIRIAARKSAANPDISDSDIEDIASNIVIKRRIAENALSNVSDDSTNAKEELITNALRKTAAADYDIFNLLHFSDLHGNAARLENVIEFYNSFKTKYAIQDALLTGDIVYAKYSNGMSWFDAVDDSENILLVIGNHDATEATIDYETNEHTQAELWDQYYSTRISNWNVVNTSGNTYYYKDYSDSGIRLIVLNSMLGGDDATAQLTWLEGVLDSALNEELAVIVSCHYRSNSAQKLSCNFTDRNMNLVNYTKNALSPDAMALVQNFISSGGEFVCYLCGHMHTDIVSYNSDYPSQLFVSVVDAYGFTNYQSDLDRKSYPNAFNLFFVDRSNHCFKIVRMGADCDSYLRSRDCITVDYQNKEIITMR